MRHMGTWLGVIGLALCFGCGKGDVPEDKKDYVGNWTGPDNFKLSITKDGRAEYKHKGTSVSGPIQFAGDDFKIGVWVLNKEFSVSEAPHMADGKWRMTVEGVDVTRPITISLDELKEGVGAAKVGLEELSKGAKDLKKALPPPQPSAP